MMYCKDISSVSFFLPSSFLFDLKWGACFCCFSFMLLGYIFGSSRLFFLIFCWLNCFLSLKVLCILLCPTFMLVMTICFIDCLFLLSWCLTHDDYEHVLNDILPRLHLSFIYCLIRGGGSMYYFNMLFTKWVNVDAIGYKYDTCEFFQTGSMVHCSPILCSLLYWPGVCTTFFWNMPLLAFLDLASSIR